MAVILLPLVGWNFKTLYDTQLALTVMTERVIVLERDDVRRDERNRSITDRRDDQINEIVQRLARVEGQNSSIAAALERLADRLDREKRGETPVGPKRAARDNPRDRS